MGEEFPGFSLAALPVPSAQLVQLVLSLKSGACLERSTERGLVSLLGTLLTRGCGELSREQFARDIDSRGADLSVYPARDSFTVEMTVLPEDLQWALETMARMLAQPRLEEEEVSIARQEHLQQMEARADEQRLLLSDSSRAAIFREGHSYARPLGGTIECLEQFDGAALSSVRARLLGDGVEVYLCAAGRFELSRLQTMVHDSFSFLKTRNADGRFDEGETFAATPPRYVPVEFSYDQSRILIGIPALARSAPNYLEASFANEIFGGAFISRLTRAVRSKEGLAYSAGSRLWSGAQGGCLWMGLQTDHGNVGRALSTIRVCMDQILRDGLPAQELAQFKEFILCSLPFEYDSLSSWCSRFMEFFHYGSAWQPDRRRQLLEERIHQDSMRSVFQELLQAERATVCVLGLPQPEGAEERFFSEPTSEDRVLFGVSELKADSTKINSRAGMPQHQIVAQSESASLVRYPNGVHLLSLPRPELLSISLQVWTMTGSMDEPPGRSGMSHFLEHLMFRGTEDFPDGDFDLVLARRGGLNNAFTSEDFTVYTDYVVLDGLEEALCLEADRFQNLTIEEEVFRTEKDVVLEERSLRVDANPLGKLYEKIQARAFGEHPYGWPVIGWREELEQLEAEHLREHYRSAIRPERLMVVVAGGCPQEVAVELVGRTLGTLPGSKLPSPWPALDPGQAVTPLISSELELSERSGYSYLVGCYRVPREGHPDYEAVELLSRVLGQGDSSRLHDHFVRKTQRVLEVWLSYESQTRDHPLLYIGMATTEPLVDDSLRQELLEFLESVANDISEEELSRARIGWIAEAAFGSDELEDWSLEIAARVMLLPWEQVFSARERIEAVTVAQVRDACRRYLLSPSVFARLNSE